MLHRAKPTKTAKPKSTKSTVLKSRPKAKRSKVRLVASTARRSISNTSFQSSDGNTEDLGSLASIYAHKKLRQVSPATTTTQLAQEYDPLAVESGWNEHWRQHGLFTPSLLRSNKFVMLLPPPNVTGTLHIGHALTVGIQDTITRYKRMSGHSTLWVPGIDHAGIATQVVVEKQLKKTLNKSRHDIGREEFINQVWEWKNKYGNSIVKQLEKLGTSLDWTRNRFTLDSICADAVIEAFLRLHESDVIYRDNRIVSWCCTLKSAISSIEIDTIDVPVPTFLNVPNYPKPVEVGVIHDFKYRVVTRGYAKKVKNGEVVQDLNSAIDQNDNENFITISTTRMETMLGDVAVAVHPEDPRYKKFQKKGKGNNKNDQNDQNANTHSDSHSDSNSDSDDDLLLEHPIIPGYFIPVIFDDILVDMEFGTGAVKITPAHDPNDYQSALRHNLPLDVALLDDQGHFSHPFHSEFDGLHRFEVRERVIDILTKRGFYKEKRPNPMAISICSRSGDLIEPRIKPQWWIRSDNMAKNAKKAADEGIEVVTNVDGVDYCTASVGAGAEFVAHKNIKKQKLSFTPSNSYNDWAKWLDNNQDWCISRQLWWGHRIPAWYVSFEDDGDEEGEDLGRWVIARNEKHAQEKANLLIQTKYPNKKLKKLSQDEDVLDTWFSSGLFPFSVMGWPHEGVVQEGSGAHNDTISAETKEKISRNKDFLRFFPGSLLETGNDILFFWVARMAMLSQTLTGALPFEHVYLHTLIRDKSGRKMSKSLGNVIDPIDVINGVDLAGLYEKLKISNLPESEVIKARAQQEIDFPIGIPACGADSLRFGLLSYTRQSGDINLDINTIVTARHFKNKIWQAMRFAMGNVRDSEGVFTPPVNGFGDLEELFVEQAKVLAKKQFNGQNGQNGQNNGQNGQNDANLASLQRGTFEQQWLLHRLSKVVDGVNGCFERYEFGEATQLLQKFFIEDLCGRFLEISKTIVRKSFFKNGVEEPNVHYDPVSANATLNTLIYSLETFLKLLHPISPHLTEELWFSLPAHLEKVRNNQNLLQNEILPQILTTLEKISSELASAQGPSTAHNIAVNKAIFDHLEAVRAQKGPKFAAQIDKFLDHTSFDLKTYQNRVDHIRKINGDGLKYELKAEEQLMSKEEIEKELQSLVTRTASGSISTEQFPSLKTTPEMLSYFNDDAIASKMERLVGVIDKIRVVKARLQIPNHIKPRIVLEYIAPEGGELGNEEGALEEELLDNLGDYQHIISILSFVSQPTLLKSTEQTSSLVKDNGTGDGKSYSIKQYISDRVLCHIIIDTDAENGQKMDKNAGNDQKMGQNDQNDQEDDSSSSQSHSIDFSAELVKSERRVDTLGSLVKQLEATIESTKDNPKVPEKIKQKNSSELKSSQKELQVLSQNIASLHQVVPAEIYKSAKVADLEDQVGVVQKAKEKVLEVMRGNEAKNKEKAEKANAKHQETVKNYEGEIAALRAQIEALA